MTKNLNEQEMKDSAAFLLLVNFLLICPLIIPSTATAKSATCDSTNCILPLCKCSNTEPPANMDLEDVPMMVGLSFNGILTAHHMKHIKQILNPVFKNPNGCPTQATFFVSDQQERLTTDYCVVQSLFNNNNEIGVGATKYT